MGLGRFTMWVKRPLGPLSSGYKDHSTHNAPFFPGWNFVLFQLGKILCFKSWCGKLKGLGKSTSTSNASEDEACLDTKRLGSARFPTCLWRPLGSECCLFYYFTKSFACCNFISPVLLQTLLSRKSLEVPRLLSIFW